MKEYIYDGMHFSADATLVGRELESIEKDNKIEPVDVVQFARERKDSALHECFEWDNSVAGEKYRLYQAKTLIGSIKVVVKDENNKITNKKSVYVSVSNKKENKRDRISVSKVNLYSDAKLQDSLREDIYAVLYKYRQIMDMIVIRNIVNEQLDKVLKDNNEE